MALHARQKDKDVRMCACWCHCRNRTARQRTSVGYVLCRPCGRGSSMSLTHGVSRRRVS